MTEKLGELSFANQTLTVARFDELGLTKKIAPRTERDLERSDFLRILCPNCRASYILSDEWGES